MSFQKRTIGCARRWLCLRLADKVEVLSAVGIASFDNQNPGQETLKTLLIATALRLATCHVFEAT